MILYEYQPGRRGGNFALPDGRAQLAVVALALLMSGLALKRLWNLYKMSERLLRFRGSSRY